MKKIPLSQGKYALVDNEDYDFLIQWKWNFNGGYARHSVSRSKKIFMHRLIMKTPHGVDTDHKNGNKIDNRKSNLRVCTRSQNRMNTSVFPNTLSGFKGVTFDPLIKKWRARITINKVVHHLGWYKNKWFAVEAYRKSAKELFKEFARA